MIYILWLITPPNFTGAEDETGAYIDWLFIKVRNMLKSDLIWLSVERLANELLKTPTIGYVKARKIIREAYKEAMDKAHNR